MPYKLTHEDSEIFADFLSRSAQIAYIKADAADFWYLVFLMYRKSLLRYRRVP